MNKKSIINNFQLKLEWHHIINRLILIIITTVDQNLFSFCFLMLLSHHRDNMLFR